MEVEGLRYPLFMLSADLPVMEDVRKDQADTKKRIEFLAPLDPMMWDRNLIEALWGFRYSWEIYTPAAKRQFGHYVLPVIFGDRFIGRIEPKADRKAGILTVGNIWLEPGVKDTKSLSDKMNAAVRRFARFNGCAYRES